MDARDVRDAILDDLLAWFETSRLQRELATPTVLWGNWQYERIGSGVIELSFRSGEVFRVTVVKVRQPS